jgi:hypothetical protein
MEEIEIGTSDMDESSEGLEGGAGLKEKGDSCEVVVGLVNQER